MRFTKREIKGMVEQAYEYQKKTHGTLVVFNIYAGGCYILDDHDNADIIDIVDNEQDAIDICKGVGNGCYYRPILIDEDSGERVTRKNFKYYDLESEWTKDFIKTQAVEDAHTQALIAEVKEHGWPKGILEK